MRPSDGKISLWPVGVIGFIVVLAAASITPIVRLNAEAPSDFVAPRASIKDSSAALSTGYWNAAVNVIQWKYSRTSALPEQAPADFSLSDAAGNARHGEDESERHAYWAKLREEWLRADNWHTTYSFDLLWMVRDFQSLWRVLENFASDHM